METEIIIREIRKTDIEQINELYRKEYGHYAYPLTGNSIETGIHLVAECVKTGAMCGFARAKVVPHYPKIVELGGLIINSMRRGEGIAKKLTHARLEMAREAGMHAAISEPVCNRTDRASQRNLEHSGFVPLGLSVTKYPGIKEAVLGQPETVTFTMRALRGDTGFGRRKIYIPREIEHILESMIPENVQERGWKEILPPPCPSVHFHKAYVSEGGRNGSTFVDIPIN